MNVTLDPEAIEAMLDLWQRVTDLEQPMDARFKAHMIRNRQALLKNHRATARTFMLMMDCMTPADGAQEFTKLKARVASFNQWTIAEMGKLAGLE